MRRRLNWIFLIFSQYFNAAAAPQSFYLASTCPNSYKCLIIYFALNATLLYSYVSNVINMLHFSHAILKKTEICLYALISLSLLKILTWQVSKDFLDFLKKKSSEKFNFIWKVVNKFILILYFILWQTFWAPGAKFWRFMTENSF